METALNVRQLRENGEYVYGHIRWLFAACNTSGGGRAEDVRRVIGRLIEDDEQVEVSQKLVPPNHRLQVHNGVDVLFSVSAARHSIYPNRGRSLTLSKMTHGCDAALHVRRKNGVVYITFYVPDERLQQQRRGGRNKRHRPSRRR